MAKVCCKKKRDNSNVCVVQPGANFTFLITVGHGINDGDDVYGFSDGQFSTVEAPFGSVTEVDFSQVDEQFRGIQEAFTISPTLDQFSSIPNGYSYDFVDFIYINGISASNFNFTAADVGKTYCISLKAERGG